MSSPVDSGSGRPLDIAASITLLVVAWALFACYAVVGLVLLAFIDHCPPESCSTDDAFDALALAGVGIFAVLAVMSVWSVVRMVRRRRSWWVGVLGILAVAAGAVVGVFGYGAAVG
jgi:uncharacterized BrkB/YihY/UPF0761 family membrane protein